MAPPWKSMPKFRLSERYSPDPEQQQYARRWRTTVFQRRRSRSGRMSAGGPLLHPSAGCSAPMPSLLDFGDAHHGRGEVEAAAGDDAQQRPRHDDSGKHGEDDTLGRAAPRSPRTEPVERANKIKAVIRVVRLPSRMARKPLLIARSGWRCGVSCRAGPPL